MDCRTQVFSIFELTHGFFTFLIYLILPITLCGSFFPDTQETFKVKATL